MLGRDSTLAATYEGSEPQSGVIQQAMTQLETALTVTNRQQVNQSTNVVDNINEFKFSAEKSRET